MLRGSSTAVSRQLLYLGPYTNGESMIFYFIGNSSAPLGTASQWEPGAHG
jgi:hypothetical protein